MYTLSDQEIKTEVKSVIRSIKKEMGTNKVRATWRLLLPQKGEESIFVLAVTVYDQNSLQATTRNIAV